MAQRVNKRAKACDISKAVRIAAYNRDERECIFCHMTKYALPNTHVIQRSHGGIGVVENVVTACSPFSPNNCHSIFDDGPENVRAEMFNKAIRYLCEKHPGWDIAKYKYDKWGQFTGRKPQHDTFMELIYSDDPADWLTMLRIANSD